MEKWLLEILDGTKIRIFKRCYSKDFVLNKLPKDYFDYIIDDGSHHPTHQNYL